MKRLKDRFHLIETDLFLLGGMVDLILIFIKNKIIYFRTQV